jgi:cytochrome oxidase Cu insertion factor (SCO1/SenC/PrrC family)
MNQTSLPYWLALAVLLAGLYGGWKWYQVEQSRSSGGVVAVDLPPLEDFELTDCNGQTFRSADMKGKVWVPSFFYTTCPDTCGRLNANIKYLTTLPELADVTWVSVTVDPETDTQALLQEYAKQLNADTERWLFCRHERFGYVKRLAEDVLKMSVSYKGHSNSIVVIDKRGEIAGWFSGYNEDELLKGVECMKECLAEEYSGTSQSADKQKANNHAVGRHAAEAA